MSLSKITLFCFLAALLFATMKPPLTYYGGKQKMLPHILPLIPPHTAYVEPFCGGAAVFWAKAPAPIEVLNDRNGEIVNFYKVLATQPNRLATLIKGSAHSRRLHDFSDVVYTYPEYFDELRRAWAVWMQCSQGFASAIGNSWGYSLNPSPTGSDTTTRKLSLKRKHFEEAAHLRALKHRLDKVQLECKEALELMVKRDGPNTFFYIDPPYPGADQGHYRGYTMAHFESLLQLLPSLKGKFLLSSYTYAELETATLHNGWHTRLVEQQLSAAKVAHGGKRRTKLECLTANFPLKS